MEVGRGEHPVEQLEVDDVLVLMGPEGFGQLVLIIGVGLVELGDPGLEGGDDLGGVPGAQLGPGPVADAVFGVLEQVEQLFDRGAGDPGRVWRAAGLRR